MSMACMKSSATMPICQCVFQYEMNSEHKILLMCRYCWNAVGFAFISVFFTVMLALTYELVDDWTLNVSQLDQFQNTGPVSYLVWHIFEPIHKHKQMCMMLSDGFPTFNAVSSSKAQINCHVSTEVLRN